ncbi:MAG: glutamine synthetase [Clostridia bacterium]|nr:glutamine synthetase [Clostridia bacterium]
MRYTEQEVIEFIEENNVKFIRLAFCDVYGTQKNISIMPDQLARAFEVGVPFDASAICGFGEGSDLFLFPDPSTLALLPWRPSQGRVIRFFCDIRYPDGTPFERDGRYILKKATERARSMGISCDIGAECEFYLFRTDEQGEPTDIPFDQGGYMDIAPKDKGENIRREICLTLEEMGISPESSHHEEGPGQNEIDFRYADARRCADNIMTFRMVVETLAARNGLYATFAPKPVPGKCGNGFHINLSPRSKDENSYLLGHFIAGIHKYVRDMTLFLNPAEESYDRIGALKAPRYVTWAYRDRSHLIRIPPEDGKNHRLEVRSPDSLANPYIAIALLIHAGLCGVEEKLMPPADEKTNLFRADEAFLSGLDRLPDTLDEARALAKASRFINEYLSSGILEAYGAGAENPKNGDSSGRF